MGAAEENTIGLDAVTDDPALAMIARGREHMNRAFETIEDVRGAVAGSNLERLIVRVAAEFAGCHGLSPSCDLPCYPSWRESAAMPAAPGKPEPMSQSPDANVGTVAFDDDDLMMRPRNERRRRTRQSQ